MTRLEAFYGLKNHLMSAKQFNSLSKKEIELCEEFIRKHDDLDVHQFASKLNMWMLDNPNKPKRHTAMWSLVLCSNSAVTPPKQRRS